MDGRSEPVRKLYYNMTITAFRDVALAIGESKLGTLAGQLHLKGRFWVVIARLNDNLANLAIDRRAFFALSWVVSITVYKVRGSTESRSPNRYSSS